jgi:hypothetical protein
MMTKRQQGEAVMGIVETVLGPRSKRDWGLPYTYEAWVDILDGQGREPVYDYFFSSTICGLVLHLDDMELRPEDVRLYGVYRGRKTRLTRELLTTADGSWLMRPELCRKLEEYFKHTGDECYRGHVERGSCAFEDRDRSGLGPVW